MINSFRCLLCEEEVITAKRSEHKKQHPNAKYYGTMWPLCVRADANCSQFKAPIYNSPIIAESLGVKKVYILDEGRNASGSMKDYIVSAALFFGLNENCRAFTVVSSGNHAASLAMLAEACFAKSVVFTPASSSKIPFLARFPSTLVIGINNAIFEDVYKFANQVNLNGLYNANVSNDLLIIGFRPIAERITKLDPSPTHILAGVGNGSYLAGIIWGLERLSCVLPKIIPVGMQGAFPTEEAFQKGLHVCEYSEFLTEEEEIDAAEGSIAIASYSMPQLMHALELSKGFPVGGLTNGDLAIAYAILAEDKNLLKEGAIPEPTGIMGLAAAIKHKDEFSSDSVLLISFTGNGIRDEKGIKKLVPDISDRLIKKAKHVRWDLSDNAITGGKSTNVMNVNNNISPDDLNSEIQCWLKGGYNDKGNY